MIDGPGLAQATPTPAQLTSALADFARTVEAVALARAQEYGPAWVLEAGAFTNVAVEDARQIVNDETILQNLQDEIDESPAACGILWVELFAVNYRPRELSGIEIDIDGAPIPVAVVEMADPDHLSEQSVKDLETVKGSIEKILSKLPAWLRKLMEALMEILKLTRGFIG